MGKRKNIYIVVVLHPFSGWKLQHTDQMHTKYLTQHEYTFLFMVFSTYPDFKSLDFFIYLFIFLQVASKGIMAAKHVPNLLFSAPEEGKDNANLETFC